MKLLINIVQNMTTIALLAYILCRNNSFRNALVNQASKKEKLFLSVLFGMISVIGNYLGIPILEGALANSRIVGPVVGGLLAGPVVGVTAGLIGGIHRVFLGGFTVGASLIANITAGLIGGWVYKRYGPARITPLMGFFTGLAAELVLKTLVLLISKPFEAALALQKIIGLPTMLINSLAVALFVIIVKDMHMVSQLAGAAYAEKALCIARETMSILRKGLNENSAQLTVEVIHRVTNVAAVAITDDRQVLAYVGVGSDHHLAGDPIMTALTRGVFQEESVLVANSREELGCPVPGCPLESGVEAPLKSHGKIIGSIKMFKVGDLVHSSDVKLCEGIAELLSMQIENAKIDEQMRHLKQVEYDMLRAQINPHFLFNTLSIIKSLCRSNPERAQDLLVSLAKFFRRTFQRKEPLVSLAEELEGLEDYLAIEKSRFGSRLTIFMEIERECYEAKIPIFTLQPIVENALQHGLFPKKGNVTLTLQAFIKDNTVIIRVKDDGLGISEEVKEAIGNNQVISSMGIGITNVRQRLHALFGVDYKLNISSDSGGTCVEFILPYLT
ncbi:sensor histidine kinase [Thermanaerosceptrum fracticalcis]|uniref:histidine kinase n=1 Tax=Thermanaerosceptrum fracticalcis TaxID=1712410 RepID=A0A7G6E2V9_THEFR|nr:LytS/YhcK type 5TM receptor domain-containing protein [Thermanaerosceptrum fracticalcis]QNB46413.1 sensor histidine kinase [Thermanaerosceptrum fracticalcis]